METEVVFHPDARREYLDALQEYMLVSEKVARRFQVCLTRAIELIASGPAQWPTFEGPIRFVRLRRYPYVVYFEPVGVNRVRVLAVAHSKRRPGYWVDRRPEQRD